MRTLLEAEERADAGFDGRRFQLVDLLYRPPPVAPGRPALVVELARARLVALDFGLRAFAREHGHAGAEPVPVVEAAPRHAEAVCAVTEVALPEPS